MNKEISVYSPPTQESLAEVRERLLQKYQEHPSRLSLEDRECYSYAVAKDFLERHDGLEIDEDYVRWNSYFMFDEWKDQIIWKWEDVCNENNVGFSWTDRVVKLGEKQEDFHEELLINGGRIGLEFGDINTRICFYDLRIILSVSCETRIVHIVKLIQDLETHQKLQTNRFSNEIQRIHMDYLAKERARKERLESIARVAREAQLTAARRRKTTAIDKIFAPGGLQWHAIGDVDWTNKFACFEIAVKLSDCYEMHFPIKMKHFVADAKFAYSVSRELSKVMMRYPNLTCRPTSFEQFLFCRENYRLRFQKCNSSNSLQLSMPLNVDVTIAIEKSHQNEQLQEAAAFCNELNTALHRLESKFADRLTKVEIHLSA